MNPSPVALPLVFSLPHAWHTTVVTMTSPTSPLVLVVLSHPTEETTHVRFDTGKRIFIDAFPVVLTDEQRDALARAVFELTVPPARTALLNEWAIR